MNHSQRQQPLKSQITAPWVEPIGISQHPNTLILIQDIYLPSLQPRRFFEPEAMKALVESIKQHGILQPLLLRHREAGGYELIAGERRYRAAKEIGLTEVPAIIKELNNEEAWQIALMENLQREDLNPIEETEGVLKLLSMRLKLSEENVVSVLYRLQNEAKGKITRNVTGNELSEQIETIFDTIGRMSWESFVRNRLPLLNLPEEIKIALLEGKIAYTKATLIARIKDSTIRQSILSEAIQNNLSLNEIKERLQSLQTQTLFDKNPSDDFPQRLKSAYQQIAKLKVWEQPEKRIQLEQLLKQLESLTKAEKAIS
jgi:ParB family chromosome partitioning protein